MSSIPASALVNVTPGVLSAGGNALSTVGLVLTTNPRIPIGTVASFPSAAAVATYFGASSAEAATAAVYFSGFVNATAVPGALLFAQYNTANVNAFLRGGNMSAVSLATLQSFNATLSVTIDGVLQSASINLSSATSFSNAAELIQVALAIKGPLACSITSADLSSTTMTVHTISSGTLAVGQVVTGTGIPSNTYIAAFLTGTGGTGTYTLSQACTSESAEAVSAYAPGCYFDSVASAFVIVSGTTGASSTITFGSGAMATDLLLTSATGAVDSQGSNAATPSAFMTALIAVNSNWVAFMTEFDPDNGSGNSNKQLFAAWNTLQDDRFCYVCWDTDSTPTNTVPATSSLGYILEQNGNSGTCLLYEPSDEHLAAFVLGAIASINFQQTNGRITFAYKSQSGLVAGVSTATVAQDLIANGYNFYGAYGTANQNFVWLQEGTVTGPFQWLDSYINQIWLNAMFQVALMQLLGNSTSVPFTSAGAAMLENALDAPIQAGLNFGAYGPGTITPAQATEVNTAAGANISNALQTQGYHLQVVPASGTVKQARGPQQINFWYVDNGSVQTISMNSEDVE